MASGGTYLGGGNSLPTSSLLTTTIFYVQDSTCAASASRTAVTVNVNPSSVAGSILGATTVCTGSNSTVLTLSGNTGNIQWQSSSDNILFTDLSGENNTTYTATNLVAATYYRTVVTSGVCAADTSASVAMNVSSLSVAGTVSGASIVCTGTNSTLLTLSEIPEASNGNLRQMIYCIQIFPVMKHHQLIQPSI
ncbi:hypothetical protein EMGBS15_05200 [Filimonas sp.]|nr:hypothetical protein EMGBS15_05200 [Filimonas sp.]